MKPTVTRIVFCFIFLSITFAASAQKQFFKDAPESSFRAALQKKLIIPLKYRTLSLDKTQWTDFLKTVPAENPMISRNTMPLIEIPMPDGGSAKFKIWESNVLDPALAARYPGIKTYTGQGIDDPTASIKLDWTEFGFHAMIISSVNGAVFIDPYAQGNTADYISYNKSDYSSIGRRKELPPVKLPLRANRPASPNGVLAGQCIGTQLRTYRLALAANGEYTAFNGGTVAGALAAQATTINRVNGVYERELAIRMVIVPNNDKIIFTNGNTDPYTNSNPNGEMIDENQATIDSLITNNGYDIGHVFSTGGGGVAGVGVACVDGIKAWGVTGISSPVGDPFDIDYVAHEIGHQFGANHPFNSELSGCQGNGSLSSNAEPGSGSTIMAYAGLCGSDNLQNTSNAQFHAISLNEITAYTINGDGSFCAAITATGNTPPVVTAGANYTIPRSTPFVLTGSGTDPNGDALTFSWEQMDTGGPFGNWNNPSEAAPLFRSFAPQATPVRYFPKVSDVVNNVTNIGELMPSYARTLHFRLTARDNRGGGGGVCFAETAVTVNGTAGPFLVTSPNSSGLIWLVNDFKTITWNTAGTAGAPVNCANVRIELSTDGGLTYPVTLAASTPNDGSHEIQVPNNITANARIRIMAVGNIFYDISNFNITIQNSATSQFVFNSPSPVAASSCGPGTAVNELKTASLNGFATPVNLTAAGNPAGTTVTFSTNPVNPGAVTNVTLNNISSLAPGTYNITVNGVAGAVNKARIVSFVVNAIPQNSFTSNLAGTVYQWQVNTGSGFVNIVNNTNYSGVNTRTLQISNAPTSWSGYQYRNVVNGTNSAVFTLSFSSTWNGSVNTAWETAGNWSCNKVPDANTNVLINAGVVVVNSNASCRSLTIKPAASLTVNTGFRLTVEH